MLARVEAQPRRAGGVRLGIRRPSHAAARAWKPPAPARPHRTGRSAARFAAREESGAPTTRRPVSPPRPHRPAAQNRSAHTMRAAARLLVITALLLPPWSPPDAAGRGPAMLAAARKARKARPPTAGAGPPRDSGAARSLGWLSARVAALGTGDYFVKPDEAARLDADLTAARSTHRHAAFDALHGAFALRWRHLLERPNSQVSRAGELLAGAMAAAPVTEGLIALGVVRVMMNDFEGAVGALAIGCGVGGAEPTERGERAAVASACVQLAMVLQQYAPAGGPSVADVLERGLQVAPSSHGGAEACELRTLAATVGAMSQNGAPADKAAVAKIVADDPTCVPARLYIAVGYGSQRMELESVRRMAMLDSSSWELHYTLFQGLVAAGLNDAADDALRTALRVHPALAQKLELEYLRSSEHTLPHLRRAVVALRALDDRHLQQIAAAADVVGSGSLQPDSFCPAGRARDAATDGRGGGLRPPQSDGKLGGVCRRIRQAEAKEFFQKHGWADPVIIAAKHDNAPPQWTSPQELVRLAGNESFRISWVYSSPGAYLNQVHAASQWRNEPHVRHTMSSADANSLSTVLLRPPMAAVSMDSLVRLMQTQQDDDDKTTSGVAPGPGTDWTNSVQRSRMYLNQKALPNFIEPLASAVGGPPEFLDDLKPHRRALSHFWMGNTAVTTGLHTDDFDNIIAIHRGHKSVLLFRPEERQNLYYEPTVDV